MLYQWLAVPIHRDGGRCRLLRRAVWAARVNAPLPVFTGKARRRVKVVTLLPSATEIVCALGCGEQLVGVSHSCNHPEFVSDLPVMTSTRVPVQEDSLTIDSFVREHLGSHAALYDLDLQKMQDAAPDVVVSQTLCDVCAVSTGDVINAVESLPSKPTLIDLEPNTLEDVYSDCIRVGEQLGVPEAASQLVAELRQREAKVAERTATIPQAQRPRVAFLEWLTPPFNGGHWNPRLVELAGGIDLLGAPGRPSSTASWEQVAVAKPDVLFIACCGFPIARALEDIEALERDASIWRDLPAVQQGRVFLADGNAYFSCPGPRLLDGLEMMAHAFHPEVHPPMPRAGCVTYLRKQ